MGLEAAALSAGLLLVSLVAIVGLAKILTPAVEFGVAYLGVPKAAVGIVIAALVLLPEGLAAFKGWPVVLLLREFISGLDRWSPTPR